MCKSFFWRSVKVSRALYNSSLSQLPLRSSTLCSYQRPEVVRRACHRHHYLHCSWLHLPEPPPTCLPPRFMWLCRRRPIQHVSAEWDSFSADSSVYDTVVGSETGFGPVCLRSVINESLKRLGQFSQDKWWKGRTANVRTQTLQDDGVISRLTEHTAGAPRCS